MIIRLRARAHLNAEKTSFQSQRAFNVKELPTSKSYRRQIASNVKELPMSKSFRRQKASDAKELCNNKFRRWLGGGVECGHALSHRYIAAALCWAWANIVGDILLSSASSFMPCHTLFLLSRFCNAVTNVTIFQPCGGLFHVNVPFLLPRWISAVVLQPFLVHHHIPSFGEDRPSAGPPPCTSAPRGPRLRAVGKTKRPFRH